MYENIVHAYECSELKTITKMCLTFIPRLT